MLEATATLAKSELVYRELRGHILSGRYVAGYRLVLNQIARELGVSSVPVREAIRRLEAEKLITFTRNVGAEVSPSTWGTTRTRCRRWRSWRVRPPRWPHPT